MTEPWGSAPSPSDLDEAPPKPPRARRRARRRRAADARYRVVRLVGRGGMGQVHAVIDGVLGREVARKTLPPGASPARVARLEREAQLTASLDHPGIVPVFDAGRGPDGRPWYTMRLIRGRSLRAVVDDTAAEQRLRLLPRVLAACQAVAWAHDRGVVHRDLTPWNIMIGPYGETQVVDWGLARRLDEADLADGEGSGPSSPGLTVAGAVLGTPAWTSPEQARGELADRRSDVYALGRVLELVVSGEEAHGVGVEPPDLAAVIAKATAADPDLRYADAGALARDLEAWLEGRQVSAHSYAPSELLWRLVQAWRAPLAVGAAAGVVLLGVAGVAWQRTTAEVRRATAAEQRLTGVLAGAEAELAADAARQGDLGAAVAHAASALALGDVPLARGVASLASAATTWRRTARVDLAGCEQVDLASDGATVVCAGGGGLAWVELDPPRVRWRADGVSGRVGVARDGRSGAWTVSAIAEGGLQAWTSGGAPIGAEALRVPRAAAVDAPAGVDLAAVSHRDLWLVDRVDQRTHVITCPGDEHVLAVVTAGERWWVPCTSGTWMEGVGAAVARHTPTHGPDGPVLRGSAVARLPDGAFLVGTLDGAVHRVEEDGRARLLARLGSAPLRVLRPGPGGVVVVVADWGPVHLLTLDGRPLGTLPGKHTDAAWRGDGRLVTVSGEGVDTWEIAPAALVMRAPRGVNTAAWSADGRFIATGDGEGLVQRWTAAGEPAGAWQGRPGVVKGLAFVGDDLWYAGVEPGTTGRIGADGVVRPHPWPARARALWPHGEGVVVTSWSAGLHALTADDGAAVVVPGEPMIDVTGPTDGRALYLQAERPWLRRWDPATGEVTVLLPDERRGGVAVSADGRRVAWQAGATVTVAGADDGLTPVATVCLPDTPTALALDPTGDWLGAGFQDGGWGVWPVADAGCDAAPRAALRAHDGRVSAVVWSPAGDAVVTVSWDHTARRWAAAGWTDDAARLVGALRAREEVGAVALAPLGPPAGL